MSSPCNSLNVIPIKVSQLVRYNAVDLTDYILTVESGSKLYSRKSTFSDIIHSLTHYTSSFSGSFTGSFKGKASGSFIGSHYGLVVSKNLKATGSFFGTLRSTDAKLSGSFSGSTYGKLISKNIIASGSFSGSTYGKLISKNIIASGSFSGSTYGKLISKNAKLTGSFRGIDNITNFNGSGKNVSYNGTASYSVYSVNSTNVSSIKSFTSGFESLPASFPGIISITHPFNAFPSSVNIYLKCVNNNNGWVTGDIVSSDAFTRDDTGGNASISGVKAMYHTSDNSNIVIYFRNDGGTVFKAINKTPGDNTGSATASGDWQLFVTATYIP